MQDLFQPNMSENAVKAMSALALAHMGDAVFELLVRTRLCLDGGCTNHRLHRETVARVCASAQAVFAEKLLPLLTEEETAYYRRGRNAHPHGIPKNATPGEYSRATGVEALFGALYLLGRRERAAELFDAVTARLPAYRTEGHHAV